MAATKVRGITIEINGDTTGLDKSLKNINSEIGSTQKQLKDVDRLLKLDPANTELMAQKQRLLGDAVGETKTKIDALKQAQSQIDINTEDGQKQYDALTREIVSCETELENLEKQVKESGVFSQWISGAGDDLKKLGSSMTSAGQSLLPLTGAISGVGAAVVKIGADFESSMSKVAAISSASEEDLQSLEEKARDVAKTSVFSASEVAEGYSYMAMAGWKAEEMMDGIEGVMNLAAASGTDLATTSDIVTDSLTAFGKTAEDAGRFADVFAAASNNANTNVELLGESFKYVAPVAGSLGYSVEDTSVALGLMANSGIKASNAGTALRSVMTRMAKPTKESAAAMEAMGLSLEDDEGKMKSFSAIMDELRAGFATGDGDIEKYQQDLAALNAQYDEGKMKEEDYEKAIEALSVSLYGAEGAEKAKYAAMLAGKTGMAGLLAIITASDEDYKQLTESINGCTGEAQRMADTMNDNLNGQLKMLKSQLEELALKFAEILLPVIKDVVEFLQGIADKLNGMDESQRKLIVTIALVVAAIGPILIVIGKVASAIGSILTLVPQIISICSTIGSALSTLWGVMLANPITLVIAAVVALVALLATKGDEIQEIIRKVDDFLQNVFAKDWTEVFGPVLGNILNGFMKTVKDVWDGVKKILDGLIDFIRGVFTGDWERAWKGVQEIFKGIFDALAGLAKAPINLVIGIINAAIGSIDSLIEKINSIQINVPDLLGGGTLGFNIPHLGRIAYLANGGTLTSGNAIVGEVGPELLSVNNGQATVQPLTGNSTTTGNITGILGDILSQLKAGTNMYLDGDTLVGSTADRMNEALGTIVARSNAL